MNSQGCPQCGHPCSKNSTTPPHRRTGRAPVGTGPGNCCSESRTITRQPSCAARWPLTRAGFAAAGKWPGAQPERSTWGLATCAAQTAQACLSPCAAMSTGRAPGRVIVAAKAAQLPGNRAAQLGCHSPVPASRQRVNGPVRNPGEARGVWQLVRRSPHKRACPQVRQ